jgi:hypothetical protein
MVKLTEQIGPWRAIAATSPLVLNLSAGAD